MDPKGLARILFCGEVRGRISALQLLLQALQNKGPFDYVLCVGNFFASPQGDLSAASCSSSSLSGDTACENQEDDLAAAVRAELAQQFAEAFKELQDCCSKFPLPLYVIDEAASLCVLRAQRTLRAQCQREQQSSDGGRNESGIADVPRVKEEGGPADSNPTGGSKGLSPGNVEKPTDSNPGTEETDVAPPEAPSQPSLLESTAPESTYTPLQLVENVWLLSGAGIAELHELRVAFYALPGAQQPQCKPEEVPQRQKQQEGKDGNSAFATQLCAGWGGFKPFRGRTDILLTTRPPVGIFDGLPPEARPDLPQQQGQQQVLQHSQVKEEESTESVPGGSKDDVLGKESASTL